MSTITAADYTIEMNISEENYKKWYDSEYKKPGGDFSRDIPPAMSLKKHIVRVLEEKLTAELEIKNVQQRHEMTVTQLIALKAQPGHFKQLNEIKIADIVFAFSNNKLIEELKVRGQSIVSQKWDQFKKSEQKIQVLLTNSA